MEQPNNQSVKNLEDELRSMILGNVRMGQQQQANQNYHQQGRGYQGPPHSSPQAGFDGRQYHDQTRGGRGRAYQSRGRGNYGGPPPRGGFHNNIPVDRQEGFNQFKSQHGRGHGPSPGYHRPSSQHFPAPYNQTGPHYAQMPSPMDSGSFQRGPPGQMYQQHPAQNQQLWHGPGSHQFAGQQSQHANDTKAQYLDQMAAQVIPGVEMAVNERAEKDGFRVVLQRAFDTVKAGMKDSNLSTLSLEGFGSFRSGFATKGSDMDLVIVSQNESRIRDHLSLSKDGLPRLLEKELLNLGYGTRLLSRTRVPIIKICEKPSPELLQALREAREQWDALPEDQQLDNSGQHTNGTNKPPQSDATKQTAGDAAIEATAGQMHASVEARTSGPESQINQNPTFVPDGHENPEMSTGAETAKAVDDTGGVAVVVTEQGKKKDDRSRKTWSREKARGPLDFPKDGVGIQCDINFFNPLGIHNTEMLRLYALCDPRVRPMVLFVKAWAKKRKINHPYSGTLSSYGYVLMVLHYLINVVRPSVLPNLQLEAQKADMPGITIDEWDVKFWRNEEAITQRVRNGQLTRNGETLGALLRGFFQYFAVTSRGFGYVWMQDVLSLRTPGGIISKRDKGWTGAKTETMDTKEVRHRYLFAIEDPFEQSHNVGRTVTHNGIIAIRDEFRRAYRILGAIGNGVEPSDGHLFDSLVEPDDATEPEQAVPTKIGGTVNDTPNQENTQQVQAVPIGQSA